MTDPIIPGIPDARAREILGALNTLPAWHVHIKLQRPMTKQRELDEMEILIDAGIARVEWVTEYRGPDHLGAFVLTPAPAGRALWERIKTDDR